MKENNLDDFLRNKVEGESPELQDDWNRISSRVAFMNFFKFGVHHYNIYYTLLIVAGFAGIMTALFGLNNNPEYVAKSKAPQRIERVAPNKASSERVIYVQEKSQEAVKIMEKEIIVKHNSLQPLENIAAEEIVSYSEPKYNADIKTSQAEPSELYALESKPAYLSEMSETNELKDKRTVQASFRRYFFEVYTQPVFSDDLTLHTGVNPGLSEKTKNRQSYGLAFGVMINKWRLQSGLQFTLVNKDFSNSFYKNEIDNSKRTYKLVKREIFSLNDDGKGDVIVRYDTIWNARSGANSVNYSFNHVNSYKFLEVPIYLGYSFRYKKTSFVVKGGFIYDLYKNAKGEVVTSEQTTELKVVPFYKSNFTLSSSLGLFYRLTPFVSIMVEPSMQYRIGNNNQAETFSLERSQFSTGLRTGLSFDF